jgi:hypothetical protein
MERVVCRQAREMLGQTIGYHLPDRDELWLVSGEQRASSLGAAFDRLVGKLARSGMNQPQLLAWIAPTQQMPDQAAGMGGIARSLSSSASPVRSDVCSAKS